MIGWESPQDLPTWDAASAAYSAAAPTEGSALGARCDCETYFLLRRRER